MLLYDIVVLVEGLSLVTAICSVSLFYSLLESIDGRNLIEMSCLFLTYLTGDSMIRFRSDYNETSEIDRLDQGSL